jgi:hypothetical protein
MARSFLEATLTKNGRQVWSTLDPAHQVEIVMMLARLIAKAVERDDVSEEARDE